MVVIALSVQGGLFAQIPVTHRPLNDSPDDFRFAILPDRNGGMRPGIFEDAIAKIELLQPAFVITIGDLIDGYTTDPKKWQAEWDEFDGIVAGLKMPFYFVPGNHDLSNAVLLDAWKKRRGDPWYSFVYKNVLFVCLNTEDRPFGGLGGQQITWAKQTLADHPDVRWTLLFFHRPLWMDQDEAGYEQVRAALKGRNYTVFSGHLHHYVAGERDGMKHYVLATVGGESKVRGNEVGEFDHLTWVTMKSTGPIVVNLQLDGIVPDDVVTEAMLPRVDALRDGSWLKVEPVVQQHPEFKQLAVPVHLANPTDFPLHVHGVLAPVDGIHFRPAEIDHVVPPNHTDTIALELVANGPAVSIHALNEAELSVTLTGGYQLKEKEVDLPVKQPIPLDWQHVAPRATQRVTLDGKLDEWPANAFTMVNRPMAMQEGWDWHGPADGHFRFAVQHREGKVLVAIETFDDHLITSANPTDLQDRLYVHVRTSTGTTKLEGIAGTTNDEVVVRATPTGLIGEFSVTLPPGEKTFHLNIGWMDH
ncbi:MAG: metallophosphoesterase, partial [Lacunisphaera sp.]